MLAMSQGLAKQIAESVSAFGGKAGSLTVGTRFASDNDDWSEGAIRIVNEAGERVADFTKRYTKDANKALQQFGEDSTRALVATLKATDLSDEFDALFAGVDPLKNSVAELSAVLERASAIQQQTAAVRDAIDANFLEPSQQLDKAFAALGQSIPGTVQAYEALVRAQDLQTAGGRQLAADLLGNYQLWQQVTSEAEKAAAAAADVIANQRAGLEQQLMQALGDTAGLRALELDKLDQSNRALQERIWSIEDEAAATEKAAASADAVASQRAGLERQIMEIMGDTQGIRTLELSALDQSNRALQERIWAIQDETAAQKQAAQAMEQIRATYDRITTGVSAGFDDSIRNVRLSVLDNEGKYSLLDSEAARYRDMLMSVSDPQLLESYASKLKATLDQSYGLLTPEQQKETADEFVARYQQANDLVLERLQQSQDRAIKDQQATSDAVKAAVVSAAEQAAQIIRAAGAAVPERVSVAVSVTADPGLTAATEVGY